MAITVSSFALAANGKDYTFTASGGAAPYAASPAGAFAFHTSTGAYIFPTAAPTFSGSTGSGSLPMPFLSGDTVQISISASAITDSASGTFAAVSNVSVTNGSTVTGTLIAAASNLSLFNFNGYVNTSLSPHLVFTTAAQFNATDGVGYQAEFIANVTAGTVDVDLQTFINGGTIYYSVDGATVQTQTDSNNILGELRNVATALGVGKHVIRFNVPQYWEGVRLRGGTATLVTVPCPSALFKDNVANTSIGSVVSPVKWWGTQKYSSNSIFVGHPGFQFNVGVTGTGLELLGLASVSGTYMGVAVDQPLNTTNYTQQGIVSDVTLTNTNQMLPIATGMTPSVAHTVEVLDNTVGTFQMVRAYNGSKLASAASSGAGTISVADVTYIAAGDWLCLDYLQNEEVVKVNSISGTGPYTLTLASNLAKAHASGMAVRNFTPSIAPTLSAGTAPTFAGRLIMLGDSECHAAAITRSGTVPAPGYLNYDITASHGYLAAKAANFELIHGATQGWVSANLVSDNASGNYASGSDTNAVFLTLIGTNDNNSSVSSTTYEANLETVIGQNKAAATSGATILVQKVFSPATGSFIAAYNAAQVTAVTNTQAATYKIKQVDLFRGCNTTAGSGDLGDSFHPSITSDGVSGAALAGGQNKMANQLMPWLTGYGLSVSGSGANATATVSLPGGATFVGDESITIAWGDTNTSTVTPTAGQTTATAIHTYGSAGTKTVSGTNAQGWTDPSSASFTASSTGILPRMIVAAPSHAAYLDYLYS